MKIQYPGVAEAVETDMRNVQLLVPLLKRMAPGMDAKALLAELRERIADELDYEIEAQNQRRVHRAFRDHPFVRIPQGPHRPLDPPRARHRVHRRRGLRRGQEARRRRPRPLRARSPSASSTGCWSASTSPRGDPHPGNYILCADGKVCFLDFGLVRHVDDDYLEGEQALARAVIHGDAEGVHHWLATLGYLPDPDDFHPERVLEQLQIAGEWYFTTGFRRLDPEYVRNAMEVGSSPRSEHFDYMRKQTLPPQALLIRRMEGLLFGVLGELRAGGDWGRLALEYIADEPPSTEIGEVEAGYLGTAPGRAGRRSRTGTRRGPAGGPSPRRRRPGSRIRPQPGRAARSGSCVRRSRGAPARRARSPCAACRRPPGSRGRRRRTGQDISR